MNLGDKIRDARKRNGPRDRIRRDTMKWNNNGITYRRGCYEVLIAQYDGKGAWYCNAAMMTQQSMKACFKALGEYLGANTVEVKYLYDDNDAPTEATTTDFMKKYDGTYMFKPDQPVIV